MTDPIRVGVVGTSWWADGFHLPSIKSHPQAMLAAICGRNRERAQEMADKYGIPQVFTDYREMIASGGLQALIIATPDDLHYPIAMDALEAGLHVLCEKPLAIDSSQARAMYQQAEAAGVKHMTFFTWRWMPHLQYALNLIEAGYIGRCYDCQMHFLGDYARSGDYAWRFDGQRANGILGDLGAHMIDLARLLVGDISRVSAHLSNFVDRTNPDGQPTKPANDSAMLLLEFQNGAHGTVHVSAVTHTGDWQVDQRITLFGEAGTLELTMAFGGAEQGLRIRGSRPGEENPQPLEIPAELWGGVDQTKPFESQVGELFGKLPVGGRLFIDSILENRPAAPGFYEGLKTQEVIDAAIVSHRSGAWVVLEG